MYPKSVYRWISALTPVMNKHMVTESGATTISTRTINPLTWNEVKSLSGKPGARRPD